MQKVVAVKAAGKEHLVNDLLCRFPEYGLGDLQYQTMIEDNRK